MGRNRLPAGVKGLKSIYGRDVRNLDPGPLGGLSSPTVARSPTWSVASGGTDGGFIFLGATPESSERSKSGVRRLYGGARLALGHHRDVNLLDDLPRRA